MRRTSPLWLLALLLLVAVGIQPARSQQRPLAEAQAAFQAFLKAFAQKDLAAARKAVTENERQNAGIFAFLKDRFAEADSYRFDLKQLTLSESDETTARGRARFHFSYVRPPEEARRGADVVWDLLFIRELGSWKLWAFRDAEDFFYQRLLEAEPEHQAALLREERELVGAWLTSRLRDEAIQAADKDQPAVADRLSVLALDIAALTGELHDLGYGHLTRGYVLRRKQEWNPALKSLEQALEAFEKNRDAEGIGKAWRSIGAVYQRNGYFSRAADAYGKAVERFRDVKLDDLTAGALQDRGVVLQRIGKLDEALQVYTEALRMQRELLDKAPSKERRFYEAELVGNIATVHQVQERFGDALQGFAEARRLYAALGDTRSDAVLLTNLGLIYRALGRIPEAESSFRGAVAAGRTHPVRSNLMIALHNLAGFLVEHGDLDEALECGLEGSKIAGELGDRTIDAESLNLVSSILLKLKRPVEAEARALDAAEEARRAGNTHQEATALLGVGLCRAEQSRHEEALPYFVKGREVAQSIEATDLLLRSWLAELSSLRELRRWDRCAEACRSAAALVERVRDLSRVRSLQTSYFRQYAVIYGALAEYELRLAHPAAAFEASEQLKARALADVVRAGSVRLDRVLTPEQRARETTLEDRLIRVARSVEQAVLSDERSQRLAEREQVRSDLERLREELYLQYPALRAQRAAFQPATVEQIGEELLRARPDTAILSFVVRSDEVLIFALDAPAGRARLTCYRTAVSGNRVLEQAESLRQGCAVPGGAFQEPARWLFQRLIAPAAPVLVGKRHLVLVPDADLGTLPFAALLDGAGKPLAQKYALSYAPSVTALLHMTKRAPSRGPGTILAVGDPSFSDGLGRLPATGEEARQLGALFGSAAEVLTEGSATEAEVRRRAPRARYLHFATHGLLDASRPMFSSLALAPDPANDGLLHAREIADLELNADLVVLSACETALGQRVRGEGVLGLTWAFFAAGSRSVMSSHWQVSDESTSRLMTGFYRHLLGPGKLSRAQALQKAQRELSGEKSRAHPYYWAAFAVSGAW